jgi:cytochrome c-type biogenesis protein CcmH/NrfG
VDDRSPTREWVAATEPHDAQDRSPKLGLPSLREIGPLRACVAVAVVIAALLAAWAQWQPRRSVDASQEALALSEHGDPNAAHAAAQAAISRDPLSAEALFTLSTVQQHSGEVGPARATLVRAVHLQPSNPQTWQTLGEYDLHMGNPTAALNELRATVYLDPEAVAPLATIANEPELVTIQDAYLQALRETMVTKTATGGRSPAAAAARRAARLHAARLRRESRTALKAP